MSAKSASRDRRVYLIPVVVALILLLVVYQYSPVVRTGGQATAASVGLGTDSAVASSSSVVVSSSSSTSTPAAAAQAPETTGIVIPMFTNYSLADVSEIIAAKAANPSVPFIVVANPTGGPGPAYNATYGQGLEELAAAGITVLGYVPTWWGESSIASVEWDIMQFHEWYHVDGIYLDQMYNSEYSESGTYLPTYYSNLTSYAESLGMNEVFANSGAGVPYYFIGTVDTIGHFENAYLPSLSALGGWYSSYDKSNFAFFSYNVTSLDPYYIAAASDYVGYLYITSGGEPYPYQNLPSYFDQLVSTLASLVPVTVETVVPNGTEVSRGFNVTVTQPDGTSTTEYTPFTFDVIKGSTVTVSLQNNAGYVFDRWAGGGTGKSITIDASSPLTLTAYSSTSQTNESVVTVHTFETNGIPVTGLWTTAALQGSVVASGYTPFTFVAARGENYTVQVATYGTYSFESWANATTSGNKTEIAVVPNTNVVLNAFVDNSTGAADSRVLSSPSYLLGQGAVSPPTGVAVKSSGLSRRLVAPA